MVNKRYTSIIVTSHIPDKKRADIFKESIQSLLETTKDLPVEIIIVDNGGDAHTSGYIDGLLLGGAVQMVIHNANNMHFGFARNQGIILSNGNYIVSADNDILYEEGWLEACWEALEAYPTKKVYATPIQYPRAVNGKLHKRYDLGDILVGDDHYHLNTRAGSNCFVIRKRDLMNIGLFKHHRVVGTVWTDNANNKGYSAIVTPNDMVVDLGLRNGYNLKQPLPIKRTLRNGEEVFFNQDEYKIPNK